MIKDSGHREAMGDTGFVRDTHKGKGRMDLLPWHAVIELSKHCEEGALKYGERNIDKGAPLHSLLDSGARHLAKVMNGETDEDHLRAAAWNIMWALQQRITHPECNDMPWKCEISDNRTKHGLGDPFTNADKIRSMTDEELAAVMMGIGSIEEKIPFCQNLQECDELLETMDGVPEEKCIGCILQWLQHSA